jgi:hypothetical protein
MKRFVYLAGPILGCTAGEANDWRRYVADTLAPFDITGISPLRCEPLIGERYTTDYPDPRFGVPRAIAAKNRFDVMNCDMTLAYMPAVMGDDISLGTLGEIFWADMAGKQVLLVSDHPKVLKHPVVDAAVDWKLSTLDEAIDVCIGVLGGYTGHKNV